MANAFSPGQGSNPTCYQSRGDDSYGDPKIVPDSGQLPCGGSNTNVTSCCLSDHECLQDGICHFGNAVETSSGYYVGGCTDQSLEDPACNRACINYLQRDLVYNPSLKHWNCCWKNDVSQIDCTNPTDQIWQGPAPESLSRALDFTPVTSGTSASSTSSTTFSPSATIASSDPAATPSTRSGGLSSGAKAGIGVGVAIGALTLIGLLAFLILKRRKNRQASTNMAGPKGEQPKEPYQTSPLRSPAELSNNGMKPELMGIPQSELESSTGLGR